MRKTVTVVFCDVTGSTALGEHLDPESLRRVMGRYFDEARQVLERHGGTVEKFIGDAVMAVFGVPVLHEDDALRAVRAGSELKEAIARLNEQFERDYGVAIAVRTGINTGEVVAGDAAAGQKLVTGDAVNVAARLEQAAQPGEVLIGRETYGLVRDSVEIEELEPLELKGKGEAVAALRLVAVGPETPSHARQLESPMVGRERERSLLRQAFERAVEDRSCQLFTVLGAAGVGKSRLLREFTRPLEKEAVVLSGRCLSYGEGITFWPLVEVVRSLTGEDVVSAIAARLGDEEEAQLVAERVAGAIGVTLTAAGGEETFWAVRKLFEAHARERPLVIVFDDVQWAEPTFLDLVEHIADWSRDAPILLVCMGRAELLDLRPAWGGGKLNAATILLEPLAEDECGILIENLLGRTELGEDVRGKIAEAAEGNPLFVEEMLEMLIDDGVLRREDGSWIAAGDLSTLSVPPSIQALLSARLDRLEPDERDLIRLAAVEGKVFHRNALAQLVGEEERPRIPERLMALVRKELIRPETAEIGGDDAFRFRHQLIRDAAYDSLPKEARAQAHERFADWLEQATSDRAEYEEIIGYHLEQAYRYRTELAPADAEAREVAERAAQRLGTAGTGALIRGDRPGAINLLRRATDLLPEQDERRTTLLIDLGEALVENGDIGQAEKVFGEAIGTASANGQRALELRATVEHRKARVLVDPAAFEAFRQTVEEAIPELEQLGDEAALAKGWAMVANVNLMLLEIGKMDDALERSIEHARRAGYRSQEIESTMWLLRTSWFGPRPVDEGIRLCKEVLAQPGIEPGLNSVALQVLGCLHGMQGDFDRGRELIHRAREMQVELGMMVAAGASCMVGVELELYANNPAAAEEEARWGYGVLEAMGERSFLSTVAGHLAEALYGQGRYDEAEEAARTANELGAPEDIETHRLWKAVQAKVLARRGDFEEAERLGREAVALVDRTDAYSRAKVRLDLAEVLSLAGRADDAARVVREAISIYEEKGLTAGVRQAEALLAEL
ncbi:MAG: tetratricopeptide repeat protein [Actinobacteria bacterium]|nr:MAG: tetratricopeptide repeat protein [Actinomycetota bacterium]